MIKIRPLKLSSFWAAILVVWLQACAVDPLDSASTGGPTDPSKANYSVCEDPSLVDTDKDGMSDDCEDLIGIKEPTDADCNKNGIPDGKELLGPNCTEIKEETPCPPAGVNLTCEEYQKEQDGLKNKGLNDVKEGAVLATSGLGSSAPNGTKISVTSQFIRIVYNQPGAQSGLQNADVLTLCDNAKTFIYYRIEGTVAFTDGDGGYPNPQPTVMKLCAPLETLNSASPSGPVKQEQFNWTGGWVEGGKYTGYFKPTILRSKKNASSKITLTPGTLDSGVNKKLEVKFESTFKVEGLLYNDVKISTPDTTVFRNFKRSSVDGTFNKETTPGIVGPWRAGE